MTEIEAYIASFPKAAQSAMNDIYATIKETASDAKEKISYGIPAFEWNGPLVYFGGFKNHIGLYALPSGNAAFRKELQQFKTGKGSIQFPLEKPMPLDLIRRIVKFRMEENLTKASQKRKK